MWYEKIEKLTALIIAAALLSCVGMYIKSRSTDIEAYVSSPKRSERFKVSVEGEVVNPGVYSVAEGSRVCDVIYSAGGVTHYADTDLIDLDAIVIGGSHIIVPSILLDDIPDVVPVVNINTADKEKLMLIPGIGEVTAQRILDYRINNGEFSKISDIMNVRGIGEKTFEEIKNYIITSEINNTEE